MRQIDALAARRRAAFYLLLPRRRRAVAATTAAAAAQQGTHQLHHGEARHPRGNGGGSGGSGGGLATAMAAVMSVVSEGDRATAGWARSRRRGWAAPWTRPSRPATGTAPAAESAHYAAADTAVLVQIAQTLLAGLVVEAAEDEQPKRRKTSPCSWLLC